MAKTAKRKLIEECTLLAKKIAKSRDGNICQRCGASVYGGGAHGSHIIPVSADHRLALHPANIQTMCYHDHINWWHKNPREAGKWFDEKFPDKAKWLDAQKIANKTKGTISAIMLEDWLDVLKTVNNLTPEAQKEWEDGYINGQIYNWL
jgi:5-methylcytosine-specific restriction endonuclease McrA